MCVRSQGLHGLESLQRGITDIIGHTADDNITTPEAHTARRVLSRAMEVLAFLHDPPGSK